MFRIVLIEPEIPQNTGNIARLTVACDIELVLVGKLGFSLDDKQVRRAGMDYWQYVKLTKFDTVDAYLATNPNLYAISTKGTKLYTSIFDDNENLGDFDIVFGSEGAGLPKFMYEKYQDKLYRIPMLGGIRSINLSTSVGVVAYNLLEKMDFNGLV